MTGEATLRGAVLPVGGIKEKVLAAHRTGIRKVILPEKNKKDMPDVPDEIKDEMEFVFCSRMEEVLNTTLGAENIAALKEKVAADMAERARKKEEDKKKKKDDDDDEAVAQA